MTTPAIELRALTKRYGAHRGIDEVDLVVPPGRVVGFLGPNGAGKSTTIRILVDVLRATSGEARVLGLDSRRDALAVRRRVGYLPGDVAFHDEMTAGEHLTWLGRLRGGVDRRRVDGLVERFGLDPSRRIRELSRGNRQKVGLVQAFAADPELVILDEPTSGLDPLVQHDFQQLVRETAASGRTVFLSSHVLDEVERTCDEVAVIREGRLVAVERIEDLRGRSVREVRITFAEEVDPGRFARLAGVDEVEATGRRLLVRARGDLDAVVKEAARHHVVDLTAEQADLEAVFLAYYGHDAATEHLDRPGRPAGGGE